MDDDQKTQKTGLPPLGREDRSERRQSPPPRPPVETARDDAPAVLDGDAEDPGLDDSGPTFVGEHPQDPNAQEDTKIQSYPDDPDEACPVLEVSSPLGSSQVEMRGEKMVIGRAPECDVVIADQLVSRSHAILEQLAEGWYLVDQGSGNGTYLNGKRVDKAVLYDGDVIVIGDAEITFSDSRAPRVQTASRAPVVTEASTSTVTEGTSLTRTAGARAFTQKNRWVIIVAGLVLFIIIAWATLKITEPSNREPTPAEKAAQVLRKRVKKAEGTFDRVKNLVKDGKWVESEPLIKEVALVLGDRQLVQQYQTTIRMETQAQKDIRQAKLQVAAEDFAGAIALLLRIPPDSVFSEQSKQMRAEIERKALEAKLARAQLFFAQKDYPVVLKLAEEVLVAEPGNPEAQKIKRRAQAEIDKPKTTGKRKKKKKVRVVRAPAPRSRTLLSGSALDAYRSGDLDQALAIGSTSGTSAEGMTKLRMFSSLYAKGTELARNPGKSKQAEKALGQAVQLDRALGGGKGEMSKKVRHKLATVYYLRAVDAHNRKKYPEAFKSYNRSLEYRPDLKMAKKRLSDLEKQAQKLYDTAYVIKLNNPDKAISLCKTVLKMVRKDAYAYNRCKKLLARISGPTSSTGNDEGF